MKLEKLNNIRNAINDTITNNGVFLYKDGSEILRDDESEYSLEDILDGNKINIKIFNNDINNRNNLSNSNKIILMICRLLKQLQILIQVLTLILIQIHPI